MAKIVELLAPSGAGKSTLYRHLQKRWEPAFSWAVYHDFRYERKPRKRFPSDYIRAISKRFEKREEIEYKGAKVSKFPKEREFYRAHPEFVNRALDLIHEHNRNGYSGVDNRFHSIFFLMETAEQLQAVLEEPEDPRACLMDEGLLSRVMHLNSPRFDEEALDRYMEHMPMPDAVIYLHLPPDELIRRIRSRERVATLHQGLEADTIEESTRRSMQLMESAIRKAEGCGSGIYRVEGSGAPEKVADKVVEILETYGEPY